MNKHLLDIVFYFVHVKKYVKSTTFNPFQRLVNRLFGDRLRIGSTSAIQGKNIKRNTKIQSRKYKTKLLSVFKGALKFPRNF